MAEQILIVAGVGRGGGTGAAVARRFANAGYHIALIGRDAKSLQSLAEAIKSTGGSAAPFAISGYTQVEIQRIFSAVRKQWPGARISVAVWNAGSGVWKNFLDNVDADLAITHDMTVGAFAFSREAILAFQTQEINDRGARGTLIFTGATASIRGNVLTSVVSSGKHALRALSQSLAKEFGKQNIHVSHAIIDGGIATDHNDPPPTGYHPHDVKLQPEAIAEAYEFLAGQHRSAWTWELDLRPAHETW